MCAHEPGLFTSTMPATVRPRKTSRKIRRLAAVSFTFVAGSLIFAPSDFATLRLCVNPPLSHPSRSGYCPALSRPGICLTVLHRRGSSRSQPKLFGIRQRRSSLVLAQHFIHRSALCQPERHHLIVASRNTVQPVRPILCQPLRAISLFEDRKFFSHLAQVVVDGGAVATQLSGFQTIIEIQIRVP